LTKSWQLFCPLSFGNIDIIGEKFGQKRVIICDQEESCQTFLFSRIYQKLKVLQKIVSCGAKPNYFRCGLSRYGKIFWHIFLWARSMRTLKFGGL